jgi:hypothetical protein
MNRSNCIILDGDAVLLPAAVLEAGGTAVNYQDDKEPHLAAGKRKKPLTTFVLHETGGNSATGCKDSLVAKKLGVHLIMGKDGTVSCHADLIREVCSHANQANPISVGMEIVNPYRPEVARDPHGVILPAAWWTWVPRKAEPFYVTPTDVQMAVALAFVPWLCGLLGIPLTFPTSDLGPKKNRITGWRFPPLGWRAKPKPGIVAHRDFSGHADGRYMLEKIMAQTTNG